MHWASKGVAWINTDTKRQATGIMAVIPAHIMRSVGGTLSAKRLRKNQRRFGIWTPGFAEDVCFTITVFYYY